ncbi:MAG TPA: aldehyde dehydrogenase (NADP(+)) [Flavitalea sp.]|nr:aldehyde dehydrogenase (NADP(+)) [Flavitalea sp.]
MQYNDATETEIRAALQQAWKDFHIYRKITFAKRRDFLYAIADQLILKADELVSISSGETNLQEQRLRSEIGRTAFQLRSYGDHTASGGWLDARIDTADDTRTPPKPDLRKTMVPVGPVAVFGASNFPFAYSTAGGDTASAFAAGCPVVLKAHPAHAGTSEAVAGCIRAAVRKQGLPAGIFTHIHGGSYEIGRLIVQDPNIKAVGFTGSMQGGRALYDWAAQRPDPIPVFSEMGSINPVYLFPKKLQQDAESIASDYAGSITLGVGQFCTNPGLLIAVKGEGLDRFKNALREELSSFKGGKMLHAGIATAYKEKRTKALAQDDVTVLVAPGETEGSATIAIASATDFLSNSILHQEVFGPYSLIIECNSINEMLDVARKMDGQLTTTLIAFEDELVSNATLVETIQDNCGRLVFNGVPTGVEVCLAMQHGGPYPSCTDSRFTSVGADAIKRFIRPISFQNCPNALLPEELQDENPLQFIRTINNISSKDIVNRNTN